MTRFFHVARTSFIGACAWFCLFAWFLSGARLVLSLTRVSTSGAPASFPVCRGRLNNSQKLESLFLSMRACLPLTGYSAPPAERIPRADGRPRALGPRVARYVACFHSPACDRLRTKDFTSLVAPAQPAVSQAKKKTGARSEFGSTLFSTGFRSARWRLERTLNRKG